MPHSTMVHDRDVWEALKSDCVKAILRRRTCTGPSPRHRHYVRRWPSEARPHQRLTIARNLCVTQSNSRTCTQPRTAEARGGTHN